MDRFWLTDEQFAKIVPYLPRDMRRRVARRDGATAEGLQCVVAFPVAGALGVLGTLGLTYSLKM